MRVAAVHLYVQYEMFREIYAKFLDFITVVILIKKNCFTNICPISKLHTSMTY
jgi:hypothetical protein